jgi:hypothetical protein
MYDVKQYQPRMRLISDGKPQEIYEFENYEELLDWMDYNFVNTKLVDSFKKKWFHVGNIDGYAHWEKEMWKIDTPIKFIVRDEFGSAFTAKEIANDWYELRYKIRLDAYHRRGRYSWQFIKPFVRRYDPVPGVHKFGKGHFFRKVRTTQEARLNERDKEFVRGRRQSHNLPSSWDDVTISSWRDKSWKKHRDHQWKYQPHKSEIAQSIESLIKVLDRPKSKKARQFMKWLED